MAESPDSAADDETGLPTYPPPQPGPKAECGGSSILANKA